MWELGNEYNYHPQWFGGDINTWYKVLEIAAQAIKTIDSSRLVSSAHGDLPSKEVLAIASSIDIWGLNIYRWDKPQSVFKEWQEISKKPIYFSELGADSYMTKSTSKYMQHEPTHLVPTHILPVGRQHHVIPCQYLVIAGRPTMVYSGFHSLSGLES